jgi:hypothetical protein
MAIPVQAVHKHRFPDLKILPRVLRLLVLKLLLRGLKLLFPDL